MRWVVFLFHADQSPRFRFPAVLQPHRLHLVQRDESHGLGSDFTGVVNVSNGSTQQVQLNIVLDCSNSEVCDYTNGATFSWELPANLQFTSDSGVFLSQTSVSTTTITTPTSTTTTLPCTTARCLIEAALMSPACGGETIPTSVTGKFGTAEALIDQAASMHGKKGRRLLHRARSVLRHAGTKAARAAKGKRATISAACAAALERAVNSVRSGLVS